MKKKSKISIKTPQTPNPKKIPSANYLANFLFGIDSSYRTLSVKIKKTEEGEETDTKLLLKERMKKYLEIIYMIKFVIFFFLI